MNASDLKTPCYILDEKELINNIHCFRKELAHKFDKYIIGYSFKTNSLPRVLKIVNDQNCWAEVVSEDEYELAKRIGFAYSNIIFNGPIKTKNAFVEAINNGSIVNIDSHRELEWCSDLNDSISLIGLRVNFDLEKKVPGQTSTGELGGRFGFCYENGELSKAISQLKELGVNLACLHMHVSNASKSVEVYRELALMAVKIISEENLDLKYIDFGGGFFGGGDNGENYRKYIDVIYDVLHSNNIDNIGIIVEPGASVIATAVSYLTTVVDVKDTTYGRFVFTDGSRLDIDPFMAKSKYVYCLKNHKKNNYTKQIVCGYTCMEKDRIMSLDKEYELSVDDVIQYKVVGSYTMGFNNLFINYLPNVYSKIEDEFFCVREKWSVDEFVRKNRWEL